MDKNYNVDDILSEIKRRKSREKAVGRTEAPRNAGETHRPPEVVPLWSEPQEEQQEPVVSQPDASMKTQFDFVPQQPAPPKKPNPMEFGGHVRPLTEKARLRGGTPLHKQRQEQEGFSFRFAPPQQETETPQAPLGKAKTFTDENGRTKPIPTFAVSRELNMQDIQNMNIGGRAQDLQEDVYYEEEEAYLQESIPATPVDFSEYNSADDRKAVATDIARVKLWLFWRVLFTAVLTGVLLYFAFAGRYPAMPMPPAIWPEGDTLGAYLLACTLGTVLVALLNSSAVGGGLMSLFKMRANSDTLASLALLASIGQGVVATVTAKNYDPTQLNLYYGVASLAMLFNALGKMTMINRIQSNFRILGSERPKKALLAVENDAFCREFAGGEGGPRPTVVYSVPAGFFTEFLAHSYSDRYDVGIHRAVAPVCLLGALVVGGFTYFLTQSLGAAVSAFAAILCVCATFSATFIENVPLAKLTKRIAPQGGMVSGNKAVEDFCDTAALVLSENDLFPQSHVQLHGIKAYSQGRIDEAIVDAASVLCAVDGALSPVFLQMIGGNRRLLKKVDNIVFEDGMGLSAWVDARRVLIGNRQLMVNHGIEMPPENPQKQALAHGEGEPLYLATSGELSARFTISYHADEELAAQLDLLAARGTTLVVYTTDANITPMKIWELYGYPEELVRVLPSQWHDLYRTMTRPRETAPAGIVYTGRTATLIQCLLACTAARSSILSATIVQLVQIIAGYGLVAFMAFMGVISSLTILQLCVYQIFWFFAIFILQKAKQS